MKTLLAFLIVFGPMLSKAEIVTKTLPCGKKVSVNLFDNTSSAKKTSSTEKKATAQN